MSTREIMTLQLGHYANFVGTHWWNIQERHFSYDPQNPSETNPDVFYREGKLQNGQVTFTPRLLLVDLKGSLGYLSESGDLYKSNEEPVDLESVWNSKVSIDAEPPIEKPEYIKSLETSGSNKEKSPQFDLESESKKWVDFLIPRFHPRTVNVIKQYTHESETQPFDVFTCGQNLWKTEVFSEDFADKIRSYVEECDSLQGFQVLLDSGDGFGGLGSSCIQHLRDEYNKSILTFPVIDGKESQPSASDLIKAVNTALCWQQLGEHSSLFSPLCCGQTAWPTAGRPRKFPNLSYRPDLKYHSAALLATALDTLSLRFTSKKTTSALSDLCTDLVLSGRKAAITSLSLPFPMVDKQYLIDVLDQLDDIPWTSLTPSCDVTTDRSLQSLVLRGVSEDRLKKPVKEAKTQMAMPAYRCNSVHEMMSLYFACNSYACPTHLTTLQSKMKIVETYPKIFNENVGANGNLIEFSLGEDVKAVPVMAGLHSCQSLAGMFQSLHKQARRVNSLNKFSAFVSSGLEQDEFEESLADLLQSAEAYEDHYD